jgi:hypothetical protein
MRNEEILSKKKRRGCNILEEGNEATLLEDNWPL